MEEDELLVGSRALHHSSLHPAEGEARVIGREGLKTGQLAAATGSVSSGVVAKIFIGDCQIQVSHEQAEL